MGHIRRNIIAGNWKLNKTSLEAITLVNLLKRDLIDITDVEIVVCPPFTALVDVHDLLAESNIGLGAQNLYWEDSGAFTGEISALMLKEIGEPSVKLFLIPESISTSSFSISIFKSSITVLAFNQFIGKTFQMPALLPHHWIGNNRGIKTNYILSLLHKLLPPRFFDVVFQLHTQRTKIPEPL